jgi:hypothetical protein
VPFFQTETDSHGYYSAKVDTSGTYEVSLWGFKHGDRRILFGDGKEIQLTSSTSVMVPDIALGDRGTVVVTWRKGQFKPLPLLRFASTKPMGEDSSFEVPDSGRYTVYISPGRYRVSFTNSKTVDVSTGQTVNLDLGK